MRSASIPERWLLRGVSYPASTSWRRSLISERTCLLTTIIAGEEESRPTGRAIKERITKIKEILKNSTGKSLAGPSTPGKRPRNKVAKTPKAPKTPKDSTPARRSRKKNNENSVKFEAPIKVESTDEDDEASEEAAVKTEEAAVKTEAAISESDAKAPGEHETWSDLEEEL